MGSLTGGPLTGHSAAEPQAARRSARDDKIGVIDDQAWLEEGQQWHPYELKSEPMDSATPHQPPFVLHPAAGDAAQRTTGRTSRATNTTSSGVGTNFGRKQEILRCQVDTCCAELSDLKEYYIRYKICEKCQKMRSIIRDGKRQRFCQLCGRFHNIEAFDGEKRSCRTRLQRHNARRRKQKLDIGTPQRLGDGASGSMDLDEPLKVEEGATCSRKKRQTKKPAYLVQEVDMASVSHALSPSVPENAGWGPANPDVMLLAPQLPLPGRSLQWLSEGSLEARAALSPFGEQAGASAASPSASRPSGSREPSSTQAGPASPGGRSSPTSQMSELASKASISSTSTAPAPETSRGAVWAPKLVRSVVDAGAPSVSWPATSPAPLPSSSLSTLMSPSLDIFGPAAGACKPMDMLDLSLPDSLDPDCFFAPRAAEQLLRQADMHIYPHPLGEVSLGERQRGVDSVPLMGSFMAVSPGLPPLPLDWQAPQLPAASRPLTLPMPVLRPVSGLAQPFPAAPPEFSDPRYAAQHTMPAYAPMGGFEAVIRPREFISLGPAQPLNHIREAASQSELENARFVLGQSRARQFTPVEVRARLSAKLINISPEELPPNLREHLVAMVAEGVQGLEGYIRPGCVYLTVSLGLAPGGPGLCKAVGVKAALDRLMGLPGSEFWQEHTAVVQLYQELALIRGGCVVRTMDLNLSSAVYPSLLKAVPSAVPAGKTSVVELTGTNLHLPGCVVIARCQGKQRYLQPTGPAPAQASTCRSGSPMTLRVLLPADMTPGAWQIEVSSKSCLTDYQVVMVSDNAEVVAELRELEASRDGADDVRSILLELDRVVEFLNVTASVKAGCYDKLRSYGDADYDILVRLARRALLTATRLGWPAVARMVVGVACMGATCIVDVIRSLHSMSGGFSLLHLGVCSGNLKMVEFLLEWTSAAGFELSAAAPGPGDFTPMHLATLLPDDGQMTVLLTSLCVDGKDAWNVCARQLTPFDLARLAGTADSIQSRLFAAARHADEVAAAGDAAIVKACLLEGSDEEYYLSDTDAESLSSEEDVLELDDQHRQPSPAYEVGAMNGGAHTALQPTSCNKPAKACWHAESSASLNASVEQRPAMKGRACLMTEAPLQALGAADCMVRTLDQCGNKHPVWAQKDVLHSPVKGMPTGTRRARSVSEMLQDFESDDEEGGNINRYMGLSPLACALLCIFMVYLASASLSNAFSTSYHRLVAPASRTKHLPFSP